MRKTPGARNDLAKLLADEMQEMLLETTALAGLTPEQALAATAKAVATPSAALAAANSNGAA